MVQVQYFETGTSYGLQIWHQYDERVKSKGQKVLETNSYVYIGYRGKTGRGHVLPPNPE